MSRVWVLRSLRSPDYERLAIDDGLVAIGWPSVRDLSWSADESQVRDAVSAALPFSRPDAVRNSASELFQFRSRISRGDLVVLLRRSSPDAAVGWITGEYRYRDQGEPDVRHVRSVHWRRTDLARSSVAWLLVDMDPLAMIFCVAQQDAVEKLVGLLESDSAPSDADALSLGTPSELAKAFANFKRNLEYARSLATAGESLEKLEVRSFEVQDVFRAAWVQAIAALDHWVRQEITARMLWLAQRPSEVWPKKLAAFAVPLGEIEGILRSRADLSKVSNDLADLVISEFARTRGKIAYQHPDSIKEEFRLVSDVNNMWKEVALVLSDWTADESKVQEKEVRERLIGIVNRRNKIAHEYDEAPGDPQTKRPIDAASVTQTIDWIEQLGAAILKVIAPNASTP
jgi:hypothetical protein